VLLGAQRFDPTLGETVRALEVDGPIATITAGWQEREPEHAELHEHLGDDCTNLALHERADHVFERDPELEKAHKARQTRLRHKQDFYRIRLEHALQASHVIRQRVAPDDIVEEEEAAALAAIRALDDYHLSECARVHAEFEEEMKPFERESVARHRRELARILGSCAAVAIAGGHVATLLNRLSLFGIAQLLDGHTIFAWTAGGMAISDRVVLFHDSPPQGPGASEILDRGLGLFPNVVVLPQPETRLRLDDPERVSVLARRFAPARCIALPSAAHVTIAEGRFVRPAGAIHLRTDGDCVPLEEGEA
jgi:hypothetical protein